MADAGEFIQIDDKTGTDSRFFCTCFANQDETQLHGGISDRSYLSSQLIGDRVLSASADASQGKGFAAAAGDMPIQLNDQTGALLASLLDGSWQLVGGRAWIAYREPDGTMRRLYQLAVTDYASEDGTILVICKTPSYLQSQLLHKSAAVTTLSTDPDDPANPTDPTYLEAGLQSVSAGRAFGGAPVSLKAGDPQPVCRLTRWDNTDLRTGDVSSDGQVAFVASAVGSQFVRQHVGVPADPNLRQAGSLVFRCRATESGGDIDLTQANLLKDTIDDFVAAGYKIILSDGNWFCDILAEQSWVGEIDLGNLFFHTSAGGEYYGVSGYYDPMWIVPAICGVWFCLTNADFEDLAPIDDLDPTAVGIYAVPRTLPIAAAQVVIDGFARNKKTVFAAGDESMERGIQMFGPTVSNESSLIAVEAVKDFHLAFSSSPLPALDHTGVIENPLADGDSLMSGSGDIASVKTDPQNGWEGSAIPVWFQGTTRSGSLSDMWARVKCSPAQIKIDADFLSIENTWRATYTASAGGFTRSFACAAVGPLEKAPTTGVIHSFPPGEVFVRSKTATRKPRNPRWERTFASLDDMRDNLTPMVRAVGSLPHMESVRLDLMESFLYAYAKFGFSSIYSTVYPFWTRKSCGSLAYGAGTIVAGGTGRGTEIQATGAITWAPFDLPVPVGGVAAVTGTAYGTLGSVPIWVSVGTITVGSTVTPTAWLSWDDGVTWEVDATYQTSSNPTQVRFFNGKFIATRADGKIDLAAGFATPHLIWTQTVTGATQLNDIAFGTGRYLMVGNGGQARYSSDLVTFSDWAYPAGDNLLCVAYSQSSIGGFFHVGYGTPSGGGTIFRKYDGSVTTWTPYNLPGGDSVVSIADCDGDVLAISSGGSIWARSPGYADVAWKQRLGLGIETYHDRFGILVFPLEGRNHIVVGGPAQIATSNTFNQGSSAGYYGIGIPDWTPWGTKTPAHAMQFLEAQFMGGTADNWNPIQWQRAGYPITESFGLAVDPPSTSESGQSGATALDAARQICEEWWIFAGDMAALYIDGSTDNIEDPENSDPTAIAIGNIEDCFTQITAQYQPFGGDYLGKAYIQNVDVAYVAGNDAFYFAGWDDAGNAFGLALWEACRAAYLKTGIIRDTSMNFDSIQSASSMGAALAMTSAYLGDRIDWICRRPKYYTVTIDGNESAAATAHVGSFYKVNPIFLAERSLALGGAYGTGLVVNESHNITTGKHTLEMAFKP